MKHFFIITIATFFLPASPCFSADMKSFADIQRLLKSPEAPRTVESFLGTLARHNPNLFSGFTLMRESASLQSATPDAPRAIVFGDDAHLVIAFNGKPGQSNYDHIEMMQFIKTGTGTGRFELRDIAFSPDGSRPAEISKANPAICMRCHGTNPKPLWEAYDNWPGAYGEEDDALIDFDNAKYPPTGFEDNAKVRRHRQHLMEFRAFVAEKDLHPRYKWLRFPEGTESPVAPYIPTIRSGKAPLRPNLRLTSLFSQLNGMRVAGMLARPEHAQSPEQCFHVVAPVITAMILDCDGHDILKDALNQISQSLKADEVRSAIVRPQSIPQVPFSQMNPGLFRDGRVHLLELSGISSFDWSPSRANTQWHYFQGFKDSSDDILEAVWPALMASGLDLPAYAKLRAERNPDYYSQDPSGNHPDGEPLRDGDGSYLSVQTQGEKTCHGLAKRFPDFSIDAVRTHCQPGNQQLNAREVPTTVQICMGCHAGSGPGPDLSLDQPAAVNLDKTLRDRIMERISSPGPDHRMPPDRPLTIKEFYEFASFYGWPSR